MDVTIIYPKGNLGDTEQRFEIQVDELPTDEDIYTLLERAYRIMNRVDGSDFEMPDKFKCRSMSVGDIAVINGEFWMVANMGFRRIHQHEKDQEYDFDFIHGD